MRPKRLGTFSGFDGHDACDRFAALGDHDFLAFTLDFVEQAEAGRFEFSGGYGFAFHTMVILPWSHKRGHIRGGR